MTDKAPDATTISQNRRRRFRDNNITEEIFNEILRQCEAKGLVGGAILYTDSTHIKAKANKHKKKQVEVAVTPKAYLSELDAQVDQERKELGKKPFDRDDEAHKGGGSATRMPVSYTHLKRGYFCPPPDRRRPLRNPFRRTTRHCTKGKYARSRKERRYFPE